MRIDKQKWNQFEKLQYDKMNFKNCNYLIANVVVVENPDLRQMTKNLEFNKTQFRDIMKISYILNMKSKGKCDLNDVIES